MIQGLRTWWQKQTGEDETPFDGDSPAFIVSLLTHLALVVALGLTPLVVPQNQITLTVVSVPETEEVVELKVPEEFYFSEQPSEEVGANSVQGEAMALSEAPIISEVSAIPNHQDILPEVEVGNVEINNAIEVATGLNFNANMAVKGAAGEGTTGAVGAIDRLTHEILLSLEERKTLVVWCFDFDRQLGSAKKRDSRPFRQDLRRTGNHRSSREQGFQEARRRAAPFQHCRFWQQRGARDEEADQQFVGTQGRGEGNQERRFRE